MEDTPANSVVMQAWVDKWYVGALVPLFEDNPTHEIETFSAALLAAIEEVVPECSLGWLPYEEW
jgi:hypothetical protein